MFRVYSNLWKCVATMGLKNTLKIINLDSQLYLTILTLLAIMRTNITIATYKIRIARQTCNWKNRGQNSEIISFHQELRDANSEF